MNTSRHLRAGDEVVVRSPEEILSTLDSDGTLDGLPFMPEMVSFCGKCFRVFRRVEKTCVEGCSTQQRFSANDVVFLNEQRCTGDGHDGCGRGCMLFWKEAWLRRLRSGESPVPVDGRELERLRGRLKVKTGPTTYYCQSTQLADATEPFPGKQTPWMIWVALREIWFGSRSATEVARLMVQWIRYMLRKRRIGARVHRIGGPNKRTPTQSLGLGPGELVRIKSVPEIVATLDAHARNRGLGMSTAMTSNCDREYEVREKLVRMIMERTGEMREVQNTVTLRGSECMCYYWLGSCPRGELLYWREIWLERLENAHSGASSPGTSV